ncbi:hypothetical protein IT881_01905 [Erythrobacter sp. A30-3]|nr:hypothetical protein IT881_01905 [Erythrobacter sp. A30-3]|tara:strand:+ start:459 stop:1313 length:855 start_codon:yes stop_codon:yes gene_type:complete
MTDATRTAPVSKHPAFKWGVGLWFALLMGLGLFVMPESIHQALAERLSLDGVLSAGSSRIVLSVMAALLGLLIGVVLAMRVAAINDAVHDDDEEDDVDPAWLREEEEPLPVAATEDAPRRPFNPREDMHEEGIATFQADEAEVAAPDEPTDYSSEVGASPSEVVEPIDDEARGSRDHESDGGQSVGDTEEICFDTPHPAPPVMAEAVGDLSLDALTARLERALEACKAGPVAARQDENTDPVIAFLRREAENETPLRPRQDETGDPEAELRSALEKLNRATKSQ